MSARPPRFRSPPVERLQEHTAAPKLWESISREKALRFYPTKTSLKSTRTLATSMAGATAPGSLSRQKHR